MCLQDTWNDEPKQRKAAYNENANINFVFRNIKQHQVPEGVFIEKDKAQELLKKIDVDLPSCQTESVNLQKQVTANEELNKLCAKSLVVEKDISKTWQKSFEGLSKTCIKDEADDNVNLYIYVGLFVGGTIVGATIMYGSAYLLDIIR